MDDVGPIDAGPSAGLRHLAPFLPMVLALLVALGVLEVACLAYGQAPLEVLGLLWQGTWGTGYGLGQVLYKATPLVFTGLSVAIAFRAGLFNIGAEGQAVLGALATGMTGVLLPAGAPALPAVLACVGAGALAGGLWGALPGLLRVRFGAHEVITTIMLNFVAFALASWLVVSFWAVPETLHTPGIVPGAVLPRLETWIPALAGAPVSLALVLALVTALLTWLLLFRTRPGFELQVQGLSPEVARCSGIRGSRVVVWTLALAGALAGMAGTGFVLGYKHYHEEGFSGGIGFIGIAVALLGGRHPLGVLLAALLFGTLAQGGLAINARVPKDTMDILQGVIILCVAVAGGLHSSLQQRTGRQ